MTSDAEYIHCCWEEECWQSTADPVNVYVNIFYPINALSMPAGNF